jgi:ribonuclease P protein component
VVKSGARAGSALLVVHELTDAPCAPASSDAPRSSCPRVGFIVSKAVGNAVVRNRVKRRLRNLCREQLKTLPDDALVVIRALPEAAHASYSELGVELKRCLSRVQQRARSPR